jgi:hypothetical protein
VFRGSGGGAVVPSASFSSLGSTSGSGITPDATDLVGKDPLLGPLQNNGGPTDTMLPADSSPVIDAGKAFALAKDQRGDTRPTDLSGFPNAAGGDGTDIGSVEVQPSEVLPAIGALSPSTGQAGAQVVITGTHLGSATQVLFGSTPATFTVTSDTKITAAAPSGSGTVDVRVIAPGGESVTGAADQFTYTSQATSRTTTGTLGDQQLTLTTPAVKCVSATAGLPVTFTSTAKPSGTHLKFRRVAFYIDKGIRHTVKKRRGHERVTVARYVPNAISHHVPTTVRLKLTGLKSGPHTLKVVSFYSKALHKRRRKQTVTVSKKLRVSFTIC